MLDFIEGVDYNEFVSRSFCLDKLNKIYLFWK